MMEFSHGRRERYHCHEEEREPSKNPNLFTPSPSSSSSSSCWVSQGEAGEPAAVETEHMFDKVVTPSDVGKLNRLVIPKQYAEKYFPLDPATGEKGLLLCFEECGGVAAGKAWRFRYSYWNSSQSYVMTKGWSRFVKDKRLDPGDTVSFARGVGESGDGRLFIDWRRRPPDPHRSPLSVPWAGSRLFAGQLVNMYGGGSSNSSSPRGQYLHFPSPPLARVLLGGHGDGTVGFPPVLDSVPVGRGKAEPKRVRLFGVNLECSEPEDGLSQRAVRPKPPLSPLQWRVEPPRSDLKPSTELNLQFKGKEDEE